MFRIAVGLFHGLIPALGMVVLLSPPAGAAEDPQVRLRDLNRITGNDVLKGEIKVLLQDMEGSRQLLQAGQAVAREKKQPLTYNAALVLAKVAGLRNDVQAAEVFYRLCMEQAARLESRSKLIQSYGGLIDLLYENKKFAASARVCRELLELKTGDGKPREVLVAVPGRFGDVDFVPDDNFDSVKGLRSTIHGMLIQAIAKQGKYDQALKLVENLIRDRNLFIDHALKGWVLREAGMVAEAAKVYEDVLGRLAKEKNLDQEVREEYQERYRYILSGIYVDLNQIDKASEQLQTLLKKHPDDPGYNNDLGYIWADHDLKLPEAEKLIRKALELDRRRHKMEANFQENGAYLDSLGWVLFKQKKFKEAKEVLLRAVADKKSQHIEIYDHLGDVHLALGEVAAAVAAWRKGLEAAGDSRRDQQRRALVEKKLQMNR